MFFTNEVLECVLMCLVRPVTQAWSWKEAVLTAHLPRTEWYGLVASTKNTEIPTELTKMGRSVQTGWIRAVELPTSYGYCMFSLLLLPKQDSC